MDVFTPEKRSEVMGRIRGADTKPEMAVRRLVYGLGARYRLHRRDLPGTPDLVFPGKRKIIFVHGCFWHRHPGCRYATTPQTRPEFWAQKFAKTTERDKNVQRELEEAGWSVLVVWECEMRTLGPLKDKLKNFLGL